MNPRAGEPVGAYASGLPTILRARPSPAAACRAPAIRRWVKVEERRTVGTVSGTPFLCKSNARDAGILAQSGDSYWATANARMSAAAIVPFSVPYRIVEMTRGNTGGGQLGGGAEVSEEAFAQRVQMARLIGRVRWAGVALGVV